MFSLYTLCATWVLRQKVRTELQDAHRNHSLVPPSKKKHRAKGTVMLLDSLHCTCMWFSLYTSCVLPLDNRGLFTPLLWSAQGFLHGSAGYSSCLVKHGHSLFQRWWHYTSITSREVRKSLNCVKTINMTVTTLLYLAVKFDRKLNLAV